MVKVPEGPVGPTVPVPIPGSGVLQKPSDFADPNAGKKMLHKELFTALKEGEEHKLALRVLEVSNAFSDDERPMLDRMRTTLGKDAVAEPDCTCGAYNDAMADKKIAAASAQEHEL